MNRNLAALAITLLGSSLPLIAFAGGNAGGTATLSWDPYQVLTDRATVPATLFPIYIHLDGAADIRELAIALDWYPARADGSLYRLVPDSTAQGQCGSSTLAPSPMAFDGDSSYTWAIAFPLGSPKTCAFFMVGATEADTVPARFCATSVKTLDSQGAIDIIAVQNSLTILGGPSEPCPPQLASVSPTSISPSTTQTFVIAGENLASATWVHLQSPTDTIQASSVAATDESIVAVVESDETVAGQYDLVAGNENGALATLSDAVQGPPTTNLSYALRVFERPGSPPAADPVNYYLYESCPDETRTQQQLGLTVLPPSTLEPDALANGEPVFEATYRMQAQFFIEGTLTPAAGVSIHPEATYTAPVGHCHETSSAPVMWQRVNGVLTEGLTQYPTDTDQDGYLVFDFITPQEAQRIRFTYYSDDNRFALSNCAMPILVGLQNLIKAPQPGDEALIGHNDNDLLRSEDNWIDPRVYPSMRVLAQNIYDAVHPHLRVWVPGEPPTIDQVGQFLGDAANFFLKAGVTFDAMSLRYGGVLDVTGFWRAPFARHRHGLSWDAAVGGGREYLMYVWLRTRAFAPFPSGPLPPGVFPLRRSPFTYMHEIQGTTRRVVHFEWEGF